MKFTKILLDEADEELMEDDPKPVKAKAKPPEKPEVIDLRIIKPCNNPRFVIGDLDGFKVFVQCHPKQSPRIIKKTVKVQVTRTGDETTYQYLP